MIFNDRVHGGKQLAKKLTKYKDKKNTIILAIPRGGVVTGYELAQELNLPLDIVVTKKIGAPGHEEYAIGSVNMDGDVMLNNEAVSQMNIPSSYIKERSEELKTAVADKLKRLRGHRKPLNLKGKTVILTDDGIATGYTVRAAIEYLKHRSVKKIILAVPVAPHDTAAKMKEMVDEFVVLEAPVMFYAVGQFYEDFSETTDEDCQTLLKST